MITRIALAGFLLLGPLLAHAQDRVQLIPSLYVGQSWDSNVLHREDPRKSDWVTRLGPRILLTGESDRGHVRIGTGVNARFYHDVSELDAVDRYLNWNIDQRVASKLALFSEGRIESLEDSDLVIDDGQALLGTDRPDQQRVRVGGGLRYTLDPVSVLEGALGYVERDYSEGDASANTSRRDSETRWGRLSYVRTLSRRDRGLIRLEYQESDFSNVGAGTEEDDLVSVLAQWDRTWSPRWATSLSAGPRWLEVDLPTGDDSQVGLVGNVQLVRTLRRGELSLSYQRETRPSSGLGSSLDQDTLRAHYQIRLSSRLELTVWGRFERFRSAADSLISVSLQSCQPGDIVVPNPLRCVREVDNEIDIDSLTASGRLDWRIAKRLFTFLDYRYRDQTSDGTIARDDFDAHRIMIGFRYAFPIDLK